jgi:acetyl-CoA carboxylase biotin carboxyl carrier protein
VPARSEPRGARPPISAEQIVKLAVRHQLAEIEVEQDGTRIRVVREHAPAAALPARIAEPVPLVQPAPADAVAVDSTLIPVEAPMVGTFYRAPAPGAEPFVGEGDVVKQGQVLCIIEAMKLMNEIESKLAGRIARILVENGQPVEYGQHLFLVEPR